MNVMPAIVREMRAQSRLPSTYGLRLLGAVIALGAGTVFALTFGMSHGTGSRLFAWLHFSLFLAIWGAVPLLAADCISLERREGTVSLLFLTPLRARDIVMAKGVVHGLRALTLWLAVLPVMTLPFLLGGVDWREAVWSVAINFSSVCGALAAGVLASSISKSWLRSQTLAVGFAIIFATGLLLLIGWTLIIANTGRFGLPMPGRLYANVNVGGSQAMLIGIVAASDYGGVWDQFLVGPGGRAISGIVPALATSGISVLALLLAVEIAALRLRFVWQEEPPSARRSWIEQKLVTPIIGVRFLHRWMRRKLERNPIGWLEQRTWSGRLVTWSWFAVMVSLYTAGLGRQFTGVAITNLENFMGVLLLMGVASSAAGSFQRERETGVMELLLVSPMTESRIIGGRLRGIWSQFMPAIVLFVAVWLYFKTAVYGWSNRVEMPFICGGFLTIPVIGLYFSLRLKHFLSAFLLTLLAGIIGPYLGGTGFGYLLTDPSGYFWTDNLYRRVSAGYYRTSSGLMQFSYWPMLFQFLVAGLLGAKLYRDLKSRNFVLYRSLS